MSLYIGLSFVSLHANYCTDDYPARRHWPEKGKTRSRAATSHISRLIVRTHKCVPVEKEDEGVAKRRDVRNTEKKLSGAVCGGEGSRNYARPIYPKPVHNHERVTRPACNPRVTRFVCNPRH